MDENQIQLQSSDDEDAAVNGLRKQTEELSKEVSNLREELQIIRGRLEAIENFQPTPLDNEE